MLYFDGQEYFVYMIDENGVHITDSGICTIANCQHSYIVLPGTSTKNVKVSDNTKCYLSYTFQRNQCKKCNDVIVVQQSVQSINHKYKFMGKKCINVVNGEACGYTK